MPVALFTLNGVLAPVGGIVSQKVGDAIRVGLEDTFQAVLLTTETTARAAEMLGEAAELFDRVYCAGGTEELRRGSQVKFTFPEELVAQLTRRAVSVDVCAGAVRVRMAEPERRAHFIKNDKHHAIRRTLCESLDRQWDGFRFHPVGDLHVMAYPFWAHPYHVVHKMRDPEDLTLFSRRLGRGEERYTLAMRTLEGYGSVHSIRDPDHLVHVLKTRRNY